MADDEKRTRRPNGASSIYLGKDGKWHGRVTVGVKDDGKPDRRHVERDNETAVIKAVQKLERERDNGTIRKAGRSWTVEKWLTHWVENIAAPTVRRGTISGYRTVVYRHLIPGLGAHRIDKLQPEHLERFYVKLGQQNGTRGTRLRPATVHHAHRTIRTALGEAVRRGHVRTNPAAIARPPRIPEEEIIPFTMAEAGKILAACRERRNGARFVVALTLGLRKGEALGLQWRDLDFTARTMSVRRSLQPSKWQHGCPESAPCGRKLGGHCPARRGGGLVTAEVKSRAGRRTVGLPQPLIDVLTAHRDQQDEERVNAGDLWQEGGWVFAGPAGHPINPRTDHSEWKSLLKAANVRDARLHDARHTAATVLLLLGVPSRAVMDVMGWSNVGMTTRYQHITPELTVSIADKVGGLFWAVTEGPAGDDEGDSAPARPA